MSDSSQSRLLSSYHEHYDDLIRFLTQRLRDCHRAADVAQETWLKLSRIDSRSVEVINERHYIFRVAGNLAIDVLRVEQRLSRQFTHEQSGFEIEDPAPQAESILLAEERLGLLDDALQALTQFADQAD